jgi:hypothetical protein
MVSDGTDRIILIGWSVGDELGGLERRDFRICKYTFQTYRSKDDDDDDDDSDDSDDDDNEDDDEEDDDCSDDERV